MQRWRRMAAGVLVVPLCLSCGEQANVGAGVAAGPAASTGDGDVADASSPPQGDFPPAFGGDPPITLGFGDSYEFSISVEDGLLLIKNSNPDPPEPRLRFSRPLIAGQDDGGLYLSTGAQNHTVDVMLTVDQGPPPRQPGWDTTEKTSVEFRTDLFTVGSLYNHDFQMWRLPESGEWQVRLSRSGADRSRDPESTAGEGERETWLMELWRNA